MQAIHLAILWHQHQPYYPNDVSGENPMPWVRLHGIKDYIGMALHLEEVPEFHCTINLVPSLLEQIDGYVAHRLTDRHLELSRIPAEKLSHAEACEVLDMFFRANVETMIRPHERFWELYVRRAIHDDPADEALERFSITDLRDVQVWGNLCWFHELLFERDDELWRFREKQTAWSHHELLWLLEYEFSILREIIPRHRLLLERGQIEITTTPYFHPILPLLWDKRSAREAMPATPLPHHLDSYAEDAVEHLQRTVRAYKKWFGREPVGLWPSEGSVSQAILPAIAEAGFQWLASDEEVLAHSLGSDIDVRDPTESDDRPALYQAWAVSASDETHGDKTLGIVFRDHRLSDLIGFEYQRLEPAAAAEDLLKRVAAIAEHHPSAEGSPPLLVPVILDGENCWEYYADGGLIFLRSLYELAIRHPFVRPVTIKEALVEAPPRQQLPRLFAGSWISHDFAIWIGHDEDRRAWDLLHETRAALIRMAEAATDPPAVAAAWRELYIAEGSDWFWWYGDDHSSELDGLFDRLFREHLKNVYLLLNAVPPPALDVPIGVEVKSVSYGLPQRPLDVTVDGEADYFEWLAAGHVAAGHERGTMARVAPRLLKDLYFGFGPDTLLLRLDTARAAWKDLAVVSEVRIQFQEPTEMLLSLTGFDGPGGRPPQLTFTHGAARVAGHRCMARCGTVLEIAVPLAHLCADGGDKICFVIDVRLGQTVADRIPEAGFVEVKVPRAADFLGDWQA